VLKREKIERKKYRAITTERQYLPILTMGSFFPVWPHFGHEVQDHPIFSCDAHGGADIL
jgi:hypothetical protein